jgi:hypothetical protein
MRNARQQNRQQKRNLGKAVGKATVGSHLNCPDDSRPCQIQQRLIFSIN